MNDDYTIFCPHCAEPILIYHSDINCAIFRHGVYKHNGEQMNPHESKEECDRLFRDGLIYGCGKPFRIIKTTANDGIAYISDICDYI
jgi:hypothetical protein